MKIREECNNGAKQLEPQYADAEFVPESGKSEPGSSGTKCKLESGHTGDEIGIGKLKFIYR